MGLYKDSNIFIRHPVLILSDYGVAVRLATAGDLTVTSRIAFRGFSLSPWNPFYRPYAEHYPQDVERSYLREQQEALGTPINVFTVIEAETPASNSGETGTKQVVGFAIWNLAASQAPKSQQLSIEPVEFEDRSVDKYRGFLLFSAAEHAVEKCLDGHMELDNMAVDPDHFRKGFGTMLCRYGMDIAAKDSVPIGVIAAEMGMKLYASLGYSTDVKVTLTDGRENKEASVDFWVQKWRPHGI